MKALMVLPLLLVLVSLCGESLPPPPGSASGILFFDANRNGVQDSCDGTLTGREVVLTRRDDNELRVRTGGFGKFSFAEVQSGAYAVTLGSPAGQSWPITSAPTEVTVRSSENTVLAVGVASVEPLSAEEERITGVVFEDADGDGAIDPGECGIDGASVNTIGHGATTPRDGDMFLRVPGSFSLWPDGGLKSVVALPPFIAPEGAGEVYWRQTEPESQDGCPTGQIPETRYFEGTYEANFGFQRITGDGAISGVVYEDLDRDNVRDESEPAIEAQVAVSRACREARFNYRPQSSLGEAGYRVAGLPPGKYTISASGLALTSTDAPVLSSPDGLTIPLVEGQQATVNIGVYYVPLATVEVQVFRDDDGDAAIDDWEPLLENFAVALLGTSILSADSVDNGRFQFHVSPGNYTVVLDGGHGDPRLPSVDVVARSGQTVTVTVPLSESIEGLYSG